MGKRHLSASLLLFICALLFAFSALHGATIVREVEFARPVIKRGEAACLVSVRGLPEIGNPGEPLLPALGMQVLLPQGEDVVDVQVSLFGDSEIALDLPLEWGQPQVPLSAEGPRIHAGPDPGIYEGSIPFPRERAVHVTTETYRGYNIAFLRVYPVAYLGGRQVLEYASRLEVTIETAPSSELLRRSSEKLRPEVAGDLGEVERIVGDVSAASTYIERRAARETFPILGAMVSAEETYPYVIITHSSLMDAFEPLRAHREAMGLKAKTVHVGQISFNYSGDDMQEKIRNFITDAYLNWETEYVLLAGDENIVPHRGLYAEGGGYTDLDIASDLYYGALDGNWNDDGDAYWGEPDEADLMPEVTVGRASVSDSAEAANFVNKVLKYETAPVVGQIKNALMVGEMLWSDTTWAADSKDEIKDGSSAHGYTTVGFPPSFTVSTLYDRDLNPYEWDKDDLIPLLNGGLHLVNHLGHSSVTYGLRMYNSDVETSFTNDGVSNSYFIIYTQGCYSGSFDNRTSSGGYLDDCLGEHFSLVENAAVAFIGNTRYGWGAHLSTRGASQYYDRQFFDALFGEGLTAIGKANDDSKVDNIPYINMGALRWVYYELVLLGDPAMDIWTDTPGYLTITTPDEFYVSDNEVEITVTDGANPVEGARVSIFSDTTYSSGYTNGNGIVYLDPVAANPGTLYVAATAHDFHASLDSVPVTDAAHALVVIDDFTVDDDMVGSSSGNSDGKIDAGESIETVITLRNVGADSALGVSGEIDVDDPYVVIVDSTGSYGDIAPDSAVTPGWAYAYEISEAAPDGYEVQFTLDIDHNDTTVTKHFAVVVSAPELRIAGISFEDTLYANGNGCIEAGETFELVLTLVNDGSGDAEGVTVFLGENDPYATIDQDSAYVTLIAAGNEGDPLPAFVIALTPDCPEFHRIDFNLDIEFASGRLATDSTAVYVGGSLSDDCEAGEAGWTHADLADGYTDEWHLEDYRNHTAGGTYSWKFGGDGSTRYTDYGHGALATPELCLGPNATLSFWHWIHAELQGGGYAWDGSIVEISTDGGETWSQITPVGGYPYQIYANTSSPFDPNTPCFAWTDDWTEVEFDLSGYEGRARIRFRFGSDGYVGAEGWYIDDINVSDDYASVDLDDKMSGMPVAFALHGIRPNPMVAGGAVAFDVPRSSRVSIKVYDVIGREIGTVVDAVFEAGRYSRTIDSQKQLASGVYFVSMDAAEFHKTTKLVILR